MFVIPSRETKKFAQPNKGDTSGSLWGTFNVDLSHKTGKLKTTKSVSVLSSANPLTGASALRSISAFAYAKYDNQYKFIAYSGKPWYGGTNPVSGWTNTVYAGEPTNDSTGPFMTDMKVFNGKAYVTTHETGNHKIMSLDTGTGGWSTVVTQIGTGNEANIHILETYGDRLYYTRDDYKIYSLNTSNVNATSGSYTLSLAGRNGHISWMKAGSNRIWIGWTSSDGSRGSIFEWDGQSENLYSKEYKIEAQGSCTCVIKDNIPYVLDTEGRLIVYNGSGFEEVARLPITGEDYPPVRYTQNTGAKLAHYNGSILINDSILFLIEPTLAFKGLLDNCPGGIWEYNRENGFYHKYSPSRTFYTDTTDTDYGVSQISQVGALFDGFTTLDTVYDGTVGGVVYGSVLAAPSTTDYTIQSVSLSETSNTVGSITTAWLESQNVEDVFKSIVAKYKLFDNNNDKIKIRYRTTKTVYKNIGMTWTSSNTFTSTTASLADYAIGDEIFIKYGVGAGKYALITNITYSAPTYTVTIDENITGATGFAECQVQKWNVLSPNITKAKQFQVKTLPSANKDIMIQFRIIFDWKRSNEFNELMVINSSEQNAK